MMKRIPSIAGTYALILRCLQSKHLRIGRLGIFNFPPGWYIYVGSAFGPGGLQARCGHHLRPLIRPRWHIDYLRPAAPLQDIWFTTDAAPREHLWTQIIRGLRRASAPIPGFGSCDCRCPSHLIYFPFRPFFANFQRAVHCRITVHGPILRLGTAVG
jgi:Uri superfamily endonuclease